MKEENMETIRLLYPDFVGGGLETYYFGANLLQHILPQNEKQPLYRVNVAPPDGEERSITRGIYGKEDVLKGIKEAVAILEEVKPRRVITIGGNCIVSQASFDYLHGIYDNLGIIWIDTHPDVSSVRDGYPHPHSYVLRTLLGRGEPELGALMENRNFKPDEVLFVGLQDLHAYQEQFLKEMNIAFKVQSDDFISDDEIERFISRFDHILVHLDVDVLDAKLFHSTYFANKDLVGDGSGSGKMTMEKLSEILEAIAKSADIVGFTIAEYLPFDEHNLHKMFSKLKIFTE